MAFSRNKRGSIYNIMVGVILIGVVMMAFYVTMGPFATIYNMFSDDSRYEDYTTESSCSASGGFWDPVANVCSALDDRASGLMKTIRTKWLLGGIVFIVSIIFWIGSRTLNKDYSEY